MINELIFFSYILVISVFLNFVQLWGLSALISYMSVLVIFANIFVMKQIVLFGMHATASDALAVGATIVLNIIQQKYTKEHAQQAINISFIILFFYTCISKFHLAYTPSCVDWSNQHYQALFDWAWRITLASLGVYYCSQRLDYYIYQRLTRTYSTLSGTVKSFISLSVSQLFDTILFTFVGLYGIVSNLWHIIFISYCIKCITFSCTLALFPTINHYFRKKYGLF